MLFSSITFLFYFLPIILLLYHIVPTTYRNLVLLIGSLFFYAWGEPKYILLLLFSILINYLIGLRIHQNITVLISGVFFNVFLLFFFKYCPAIFPGLHAITLPLGISFYTFQILSYILDVYWGKVASQKNILDFATYVTLFPQLIAGPIVRYKTVETELRKRTPDYDTGIPLFIIGLSQKVLLANNMGLIWEETLEKFFGVSGTISVSAAWLSLIAYAFQIYFDFCGYSNMAIGLGRMFGFHFSQNFDKPYISRSITEFWTRWHISLSSWFKEYVYIPLGGNRRGLLLQLRNILLVWMLTGIWHGASFNFFLWGVYFAFLLILEKLFLKEILQKIPNVFQHCYAIITILIGWVLFAFSSFSELMAYYGALFPFFPSVTAKISHSIAFFDSYFFYLIRNNGILFGICILASTNMGIWLYEKLKQIMQKPVFSTVFHYSVQIVLLLCFFLSIAFIVDDTYNPFLYFRF